MRFGYTICYVKDVEATLTFFERAFGLKRKFIAEGNHYGELDTGNTILSFASVEQARQNLPLGFRELNPEEIPPAMELAFTTVDVQAAYITAVQAGATTLVEPKEKPWGQTVAYVRDPNGILVEIASEM